MATLAHALLVFAAPLSAALDLRGATGGAQPLVTSSTGNGPQHVQVSAHVTLSKSADTRSTQSANTGIAQPIQVSSKVTLGKGADTGIAQPAQVSVELTLGESADNSQCEPVFNVLLTGYGPFMGMERQGLQKNPSGVVAEELGAQNTTVRTITHDDNSTSASPLLAMGRHGDELEIRWHSKVLPVNQGGAKWPAEHLSNVSNKGKYDAVILLGFGQKDSQGGFRLEVAAHKTEGESGADILVTTLDLGRLALANLQGSGRAAPTETRGLEEWASDSPPLKKDRDENPAKYYGNDIYYRTLWYVRSQLVATRTGALLPVAFINTDTDVARTKTHVEDMVARMLWAAYIAP